MRYFPEDAGAHNSAWVEFSDSKFGAMVDEWVGGERALEIVARADASLLPTT